MDRSDDEWVPEHTPPAAPNGRWKWGWNARTGEATVWEVGGPGDGFPSHDTYLTAAWGRHPQVADGDVVGFAESDPPTLLVHSYVGSTVPDAVILAFRDRFPNATIDIT
jgi:hypothetical protein